MSGESWLWNGGFGPLGRQVGSGMAVLRALGRQVGPGMAVVGALGRQVGPGMASWAQNSFWHVVRDEVNNDTKKSNRVSAVDASWP